MIFNLRLQKILDILLSVDKVVTGEYLCNTLGVSSRTIRSDIKELNYILHDKGAIINSEKSKGYKLEVLEEKTFNEFISDNKKKNASNNLTAIGRAEYIIARLLINELKGIEGITQIELADELYVSLSSLKSDIKLAKNTLVNFNVDIEKIGNKGIKIVGSEDSIRDCINSCILAGNKEVKDILDTLLKKVLSDNSTSINCILKNNISKFNFRLSDVAYSDVKSYLKIMLVRSYQHKNVSYDYEIKEKLKKESKIEIAKSICIDIRNEFGISLTEEEILYVTKHIIASSYIVTNNELEEQFIDEKGEIVRKILESINSKFNIDFTNDNILVKFLGHHLKVSINRAKYGIKIKNSMLSVIKNNYPFALELALLSNSIIKEETNFSLTEDDIGFVALHFAAAIERKNVKKESNAKNVIVVCTTGVGTSLLLKVKLESRFKNRLNIIDTIPWYEFNDEVSEKADLIIATIDLDVKSDKVIYIKSLLDSEEIKLIEEKLDNNAYKNGLVRKLKEDLFFKDVIFSNRDNLLDFMTKELIKRDYINEKVRENIFKRENLASTEIGSLVAIPHDMSDDIKESFIAVAVLKKGITWSQEQVQLVLLIGMASKDKYEWKNCLEHLYKNIIDIDIVNNIINCSNFEELNKIISKF